MLINRKMSSRRSWIEEGLELADVSVEEGGWSEYFDAEVDEALEIKDDMTRAATAIVLENTKHWLASKVRGKRDSDGNIHIDETTASGSVGGFTDYLFPIVRAAMPSNPLNQIVSVQPTSRKIATVTYFEWIYGSTKGNVTKGQRLFGANTGKPDNGRNYSGELIEGESIAVSSGASTGGTLQWVSGGGVRPATVRFAVTTSVGASTIGDDGRGNLTITRDDTGAAIVVGATSINYITGGFSITLAGPETFSAGTGTATYGWNSEGGILPEVDINITTSSVDTVRRALRMNHTSEASFDLQQEYGTSLDQALIKGAAELLNFEQFQQVLREIWAVTPVTSTWDQTPASGISRRDHFEGLLYNLNQASNSIWRRTQKAYANWAVVDEGAANILESLPDTLFKSVPAPKNVMGAHHIGTIKGKIKVYKYIHLAQEPGAVAGGNMIMGYKGSEFWEAGMVWSPYQLMYTTDPLTTADFVTQRGVATRYATKLVNPHMFARVNFTGAVV